MKRVLIVEDAIEFQGLLGKILAELEHRWMIHSFATGTDAVRAVLKFPVPPDLALVDLGLPDMSGVEVIEQFRALAPGMPILVISVYSSERKVLEAVKAEAMGYLLKNDETAIADGIEQVLLGNFPISPVVARYLFTLATGDASLGRAGTHGAPKLSQQETRLLGHIAEGLSYAEIAGEMGLALSTVQSYSRNLFRKLDVHSQTQALAKARQTGLLA